MDYAVTHSLNDCHIALIAPAFWYKVRGKKTAKKRADEYTAARFRQYIEAYNSKVYTEVDEFMTDFNQVMTATAEKLTSFADKKDAFKAAIYGTEFDQNQRPAANAGYLLAKENTALLNTNLSVKYALSILESRLEYGENYHLRKLNSFINGVSVYEPKLSEELKNILNTVFCRAKTTYQKVYDEVHNNPTRLELRRQIDDYKHLYDIDEKQSDQMQSETVSQEDKIGC